VARESHLVWRRNTCLEFFWQRQEGRGGRGKDTLFFSVLLRPDESEIRWQNTLVQVLTGLLQASNKLDANARDFVGSTLVWSHSSQPLRELYVCALSFDQ